MDPINPLNIGLSCLTENQKQVFNECLVKKNGGMSLPLGFGKTLLSIVVALKQTEKSGGKVLVVMSKTLLRSWENEIKKFFKESLSYIIYHQDNKSINVDTLSKNDISDYKLILTTTEMLSKYYTRCNINDSFVEHEIINQGRFGQHTIAVYNKPTKPFDDIFNSILFSTKWGCLLIDEAQTYTNFKSIRCKAISAICSDHRWAVSGTLFDEPSIDRIYGYYLMINHPKFPRSFKDAEKFAKTAKFKGINETLVIRTTNENFIKPKVNEKIISSKLSLEESLIYTGMKTILLNIEKKIKQLERDENAKEALKKFRSYRLAMITYLRQCVVCPIIPYANICLDITDYNNKSDLSKKLESLMCEKECEPVFHALEMPLVEVLCDMEQEGIGINLNALSKPFGCVDAVCVF